MKNLLLLILLFFFTISLFGQLNYAVGMGAQYNSGVVEPNNFFESESNYTNFANGKLYFSNKKINYILTAQWNRTLWIHKFLNPSFVSESKFRTNYFNISPSIEYKPIKFVGINAGGYVGFNLKESIYENNTDTWISASSINVTNNYDFGLSFGVNGYFFKNFSLELKYNLGLKNIAENSDLAYTDMNGNIIENFSLKNRNLQIGFNYHFYEF